MSRLNAALRRRSAVIALLVVLLGSATGALAMQWSRTAPLTITGYFASTVGLYPGDEVEILGVPVGSVTSIEPRPDHAVVGESDSRQESTEPPTRNV